MAKVHYFFIDLSSGNANCVAYREVFVRVRQLKVVVEVVQMNDVDVVPISFENLSEL